ncbi:TonB family protein [Ectopseudomonas mendocina]|uniref:TonB family protein n=1 Tax=Ectopseudomonas mendocina TaxID=300 RepID=A0ABZ2RH78_ECTME
MTNSRRDLYWAASLILVLAVHIGVFLWALYWKPEAIAIEAPPAAMMVELQPLAPPPAPAPQPVVEPEPEPLPKVVEAPKPKLVIEQPKPKPKPRPKPPEPKPQPKPQPVPEKPAQTQPQSESTANTAPTAPKAAEAAPGRPAASNESLRNVWLAKVHAHLSRRMHYPDRERRFSRIGDRHTVTLSFEVTPSGDILQAKVKDSTARASFDRDVLVQLRRASPVPQPPKELLGNGNVSLNFPLNFELTR